MTMDFYTVSSRQTGNSLKNREKILQSFEKYQRGIFFILGRGWIDVNTDIEFEKLKGSFLNYKLKIILSKYDKRCEIIYLFGQDKIYKMVNGGKINTYPLTYEDSNSLCYEENTITNFVITPTNNTGIIFYHARRL